MMRLFQNIKINWAIYYKIAFVLVVCLHSFKIYSQDISFRGYEELFTPPLRYVVFKSIDSLVIDGKATETSWQKAAWSDCFVDIEGDKKLKPPLNTRFKMVWDQHALYIYAELDEAHIWGTLKKHDEVIFNDNDFEVFIDPDGDTHNYFEIEVNALATVFDLFLPKPYRNLGSALIPWDARDFKVAVCIDGTLNNAGDTDKKWSVEMVIPFRSVSMGNDEQVPVNGSHWRINFSRVEWDVSVTGSGYEKKIDPFTHKFYPEHNWVWSPQGVVNMHYPERWGYALFSSKVVGSEEGYANLPFSEQMKKHLWLIYYKQMTYRHNHNTYAPTLKALSILSDQFFIDNKRCEFSMESAPSQFIVTIQQRETGEVWQITHEGLIIRDGI